MSEVQKAGQSHRRSPRSKQTPKTTLNDITSSKCQIQNYALHLPQLPLSPLHEFLRLSYTPPPYSTSPTLFSWCSEQSTPSCIMMMDVRCPQVRLFACNVQKHFRPSNIHKSRTTEWHNLAHPISEILGLGSFRLTLHWQFFNALWN